MTTLLALDPGGTPRSANSRSATGWSLWRFDSITPIRPIAHGQVSGNEDAFIRWWQEEVSPLGWESDKHMNPDEVVSESYTLDGRTARPDTTPLKIEGALKVLCMTSGLAGIPDPVFQPNTFKSSIPDSVLKRLGFDWSGMPHAKDSARHALALMQARKHAPTLLALFPPRIALPE